MLLEVSKLYWGEMIGKTIYFIDEAKRSRVSLFINKSNVYLII